MRGQSAGGIIQGISNKQYKIIQRAGWYGYLLLGAKAKASITEWSPLFPRRPDSRGFTVTLMNANRQHLLPRF